MGIELVVGLGNPGDKYAGTRHNVGFDVVDRFAGRVRWKPWLEGQSCRVASGGSSVMVIKPMTFMNASGDYVQAFASYFKIQAGSILVAYDDMDLPLGRLRIRKGGSSGGHKGLESVLGRLATTEVPRLRLGIGRRPAETEGKDYVLKGFSRSEREVVERMIARAADAIRNACSDGLDAAMNAFNAEPE